MFNLFKKKVPVVFIHGPKTGGTYVCQHESDSEKVLYPIDNYGHSVVVDGIGNLNPFYAYHDNKSALKAIVDRKEIKNRVVISIVRNHFDWLVSYFYHAGGDKNNKYYNPHHYDHDIAQKGFDYFIKTICSRDDIWPNNKPIFRQVFSSNGDMICDYIARTHSLDHDLEQCSKIYNLDYIKKNKQRVGRKNVDDYRQYYNNDLIELINNTWVEEMDLYGFSFDTNSTGSIGKDISHINKESIKYNISENKIVRI